MYIYKITNSVNSKVYVGQTTREPSIRWKEHKTNCRCPKLSRAIGKYGTESFKFEVIYTANTIEDLNKKEIEFIKKYNCTDSGYNIDIGGKNLKRSQETIDKISKAVNRRVVFKYDLSGNFIEKYSSITKAGEANKVHITSIIHCLSGRKSITGIFQWSDKYVGKMPKIENKMIKARPVKEVTQYDKNMKFIRAHKNAAQAAKSVGLKSNSGISLVCLGKGKTSGGYYWAYKEL